MDAKNEYKELANRVDRSLERSTTLQAVSERVVKEADNLESCKS